MSSATVTADDADFVELVAAGQPAQGEFRCAECGYGVTVSRALPVCPMCAGVSWEPSGAPLLRRMLDL